MLGIAFFEISAELAVRSLDLMDYMFKDERSMRNIIFILEAYVAEIIVEEK